VPDSHLQETDTGNSSFSTIRKKFLHLHDSRLSKFTSLLNTQHKEIVDLLPLLFHVNISSLPGFTSNSTPYGIADYQPSAEANLAARRFGRNLKTENSSKKQSPILGLYLMGSTGSFGQEKKSDMDVWLCYSESLTIKEISSLKEKIKAIELWSHKLKAKLHIFLMNAEQFRDGNAIPLSDESSGSTQQQTLLDEFYRSNILLAGLPPIWWIVPLHEESNYSEYTHKLISHRFIRKNKWLDFGGLENPPLSDFFGSAFWQLHKAIHTPYKSLLKLLLIEAYVAEYPHVEWLSIDLKRNLLNKNTTDSDSLDPHLIILDKITTYLTKRNEHERLQLAQRVFYFKSELPLSKPSSENNWKFHPLSKLVTSWGWDDKEIALMDARSNWKLDYVIDERNRISAELSRSYRLLTEQAIQKKSPIGLETEELSLLGKKIYSALERRPGKVDNINPGISNDLSEEWLHIMNRGDTSRQVWLLYKNKDHSQAIKATNSIIELLSWIHINQLINKETQLKFTAPNIKCNYLYLINKIKSSLSQENLTIAPLKAFNTSSAISNANIYINSEMAISAESHHQNYQLTSSRDNPLSFGSAQQCLIQRLDLLTISTWGEIQIESYQDGEKALVECFCYILNMTQYLSNSYNLPVKFIAQNTPRELSMAKYMDNIFNDIHPLFHNNPDKARYLIKIANHTYCLHNGNEKHHIEWLKFDDKKSLNIFLAKTPLHITRTAVADNMFDKVPIAYIYENYIPNTIQVFYQIIGPHIIFYLLDENGGLYSQCLKETNEKHFLIQQERFLHSIMTRQMIVATKEELLPNLEKKLSFLRLKKNDGIWEQEKIKTPKHRPGDYLDLTLATAPGGPWKDGFSLILGEREYNSLVLGKELFKKVAEHILSQREKRNTYRVFLTNMISFGLENQNKWGIGEILHFKKVLEDKLSKALISF